MDVLLLHIPDWAVVAAKGVGALAAVLGALFAALGLSFAWQLRKWRQF